MAAVPSSLAESRSVCIDRCGSKCCRTSGLGLPGDTRFMRKMQALAARLGVRARFRNEGRDRWRLFFSDHEDGVCPFLERASGECGIYEDRPDACRRFPDRPYAGCLLWPGREGEDTAVGA